MPGSRSSTDPEHKSPRESGEDSEDESEILEESPCGRWLKRREEVCVSFNLLFSFVRRVLFRSRSHFYASVAIARDARTAFSIHLFSLKAATFYSSKKKVRKRSGKEYLKFALSLFKLFVRRFFSFCIR